MQFDLDFLVTVDSQNVKPRALDFEIKQQFKNLLSFHDCYEFKNVYDMKK